MPDMTSTSKRWRAEFSRNNAAYSVASTYSAQARSLLRFGKPSDSRSICTMQPTGGPLRDCGGLRGHLGQGCFSLRWSREQQSGESHLHPDAGRHC